MPIQESELHLPALKIMASRPNGFITTSDLIIELTEIMRPDGDDMTLLDNRLDTKFSQKVRNLVSHRKNATGFEARGLAVYDEDLAGWTITDTGRQLVAG